MKLIPLAFFKAKRKHIINSEKKETELFLSDRDGIIQSSSDYLNTSNMSVDGETLLQFNDKIDKSKSSVPLKIVYSGVENFNTINIYLS